MKFSGVVCYFQFKNIIFPNREQPLMAIQTFSIWKEHARSRGTGNSFQQIPYGPWLSAVGPFD